MFLVGSFVPLMIVSKESSSGAGIPNFGEMKGEAFDIGQRQHYRTVFHGKLMKAPKMVLSKA